MFGSDSLSTLAQRMEETRQGESERLAQSMLVAASNWRTGRCGQRTIATLDQWVRRMRRVDGVLACGTYTGDVLLVDVATGETVERWVPYDAGTDTLPEITALDWDGRHVSSGDAAGAVFFYRAGEAVPALRVAAGGAMSGHARPVSGVYWRGDDLAYSSGLDGRLVCYHVPRQVATTSLTLGAPITAFSVSGNYAACGLADGSVALCTLSPLRQLFAFDAHAGVAVSAVHLVTASQLLTGSAEGDACLWRLDEGGESDRRCTAFVGHQAPVVCVQGDGEKVVSGARDGTVRVWEAESGAMRFMLQGFTAYIGSVQMAPTWLLADGTNNEIVLLDFSEEGALQGEEDDDE